MRLNESSVRNHRTVTFPLHFIRIAICFAEKKANWQEWAQVFSCSMTSPLVIQSTCRITLLHDHLHLLRLCKQGFDTLPDFLLRCNIKFLRMHSTLGNFVLTWHLPATTFYQPF